MNSYLSMEKEDMAYLRFNSLNICTLAFLYNFYTMHHNHVVKFNV